MELLDPSHEQRFGGGEPAPRLTSLAGTTIGVISNGKENTKPFFDLLSEALVRDHGAQRHADDDVLAALASHVAAGPVLAILRLVFPQVTEIDQGVEPGVRDQEDAAAVPAVTGRISGNNHVAEG